MLRFFHEASQNVLHWKVKLRHRAFGLSGFRVQGLGLDLSL